MVFYAIYHLCYVKRAWKCFNFFTEVALGSDKPRLLVSHRWCDHAASFSMHLQWHRLHSCAERVIKTHLRSPRPVSLLLDLSVCPLVTSWACDRKIVHPKNHLKVTYVSRLGLGFLTCGLTMGCMQLFNTRHAAGISDFQCYLRIFSWKIFSETVQSGQKRNDAISLKINTRSTILIMFKEDLCCKSTAKVIDNVE